MVLKFSKKSELFALACPPEKPYEYAWHTAIQGFGARIMRPSKRTGEVHRTYLARFKDANGKDHKPPLGTFEELRYEEAMRMAQDRVAGAATERRTGKKPLPTLGAALELYIAERTDKLSPSSVLDYRKKWKYLEEWHDENVLVLNSDWWGDRYLDLLKFGKTTAVAVIRVAHAVYQSLVDDEKMTTNPVKRVARKQEIYAHGDPKVKLIKRVELPRVWAWLETRPHINVRDVVRMALFSGLRDAVVGGLRWENIDLENRLMLVPAEERGNKAKRLVWIPIADWLFENVVWPRWQNRIGESPWLIPSHKKAGYPLTDVRGSMDTLKEEVGVHINPHKLRGTFGTIAAEATGSQLIVARMLTHSHKAIRVDSAPAVTAGYVVTEEVELRRAFNATAELLLQLVKPAAKPAPVAVRAVATVE